MLKIENIQITNRNETYPSFDKKSLYEQLTNYNWETWRKQDPFVYKNDECLSCDYREATRDLQGNIYLGQWNGQNYEGRGVMIYALGDLYEGYWKNGERNGKGRLVWAHNMMYVGEWLGDTRQ